MKTTDFMNNVTVESLNAQLRKTYGISVDVAKYSKDQLEDYSKKIEAKLIDFEKSNKFNESTINESYQKNLLVKKIVEAAINQYIDNPLESDDIENDIVNVAEDDADVARDFAVDEGTYEGKMPLKADVMKCVKDGMSEAEICEKYKDCDKEKIKLMASSCMKEYKSTNESVINEGEEDKAALVMAAKDMVDRFTSFLEDVAEMSAEGMLDIQDQIRDELGQEQAEQFVNLVGPALETTMENLKTSREVLTQGVGIITGEGAPTDTIGAEPEGDIEEPAEPEMDAEEPMPADDEFGASDAATGGTEPEGREKRESYQPKKKPITESVRIFSTLSK